ncbi:glycogenin-2 [Megalobrama amblycephala]|uniref:glycogenin-2 n=1 Tax=Megalobrama amblycephala TaxID=75352 RepID=UPI0020146C84|nr:glycogenin-2 [Megalobrama amblycephala]
MTEAQAFVTLATTDSYCMGCIVVGKSLRRHGTSRKLVVIISPSVSKAGRLALEDVFDEVVMVDVLDSRDKAHLTWLGRRELGVTFTKLHCWTLTQFSKCVFLDADTLVLCNVDELFEYEELSAAPDPGWPDCFNSGVFVFRPSLNTHNQILEHAAQHGSFDGGDQGVLNTFFSDWAVKDIRKHLPFVYNLSASAIYTYLPAYQQYGHHAKIVHFLGGKKPWHQSYNRQAASESYFKGCKNFEQFIHLWWAEYYSQIQLQVKKDDKNEDDSVQQLDSPQTHQTPSQSQKSSTEAHHREMRPSSPLQDLTLDSLTISSIEKPEEMNILFDVLSGGETDETPISLSSEQESEQTEPETADDSAVDTGEAIATETEQEDLEHRRMWEEGHADYMGRDAFSNIKRKLDLFLD